MDKPFYRSKKFIMLALLLLALFAALALGANGVAEELARGLSYGVPGYVLGQSYVDAAGARPPSPR